MSEPSPKFCAALVEARKAMKPPKLDAKALGRGNREYKYASLASVLDAIMPPLLDKGVFFSQPITYTDTPDGGLVVVQNVLMHEEERWAPGAMSIPCDGTPHGVGQAATYGKRYSAIAIFCVVGEEADDATELQAAVVEKKAARKVAEATVYDRTMAANAIFTGTVQAAVKLGIYKAEDVEHVQGRLKAINELVGGNFAEPKDVKVATLELATQELKDRIKITEAERKQ